MADSENAAASSKKRSAGRQISKENIELDDDNSEPEMGTFQKASDDVLAARRIVKVRRQPSLSASPNPFAGIRLVTPSESAAKEDPPLEPQNHHVEAALEESNRVNDEQGGESDIKSSVLLDEANGIGEERSCEGAKSDKLNVEEADGQVVENLKESCESEKETVEKKNSETEENNTKETVTSSFSSFRQLSSSQNAFTSLSGTGFATTSFSFSFGSSNNGTASSPLFSKSGAVQTNLQVVPVETGEENEKVVFAADATLYEYLDSCWKERGRGEVKVNTSVSGDKARLVMRTKGNYRLILNASLYPDMTLADMDKKGITFSCINSAAEERAGLTTCALKFKDSSFVGDFRSAVTEHKGKKAIALKTPENSPKDSDE